MGQSVVTKGNPIGMQQGTASPAGGTYAPTWAIPTDCTVFARFIAILTEASAGHQNAGMTLQAECTVTNKNGTLTMDTPQSLSGYTSPTSAPSSNPQGTTTAGYASSHAMSVDSAFEQAGAGHYPAFILSVSGTNIIATVTNSGATINANVSVIVDQWIQVGST